MKLILSRKGFDSANGKYPSPIMPDGSLVSLPIPFGKSPRLRDIRYQETNLASIVGQLTHGPWRPTTGVHLDPDLRREAVDRKRGWRPCFGQVDAAQTHLKNQGVKKGDLFLFFGWFRQTCRSKGRLVYDREAPELHVIFGWLQVGAIYHPQGDGSGAPSWASDHPHVRDAEDYCSESDNNTLYVANERLHIPGLKRRIAGGGVFEKFSPPLCLTAPRKTCSVWRLPRWFYTAKESRRLSCHSDKERWRVGSTGVTLRTVPIGQEFVLDCDYYPKAAGWLNDILANAR